MLMRVHTQIREPMGNPFDVPWYLHKIPVASACGECKKVTCSCASCAPMKSQARSLLDFASCCHRPDGFNKAITMSIVEIMQINGRIDMTGEELNAISHSKTLMCRTRVGVPGEDPVLVA